MKTLALLICITCCLPLSAQDSLDLPEFQLLRAEEDWSVLADEERNTSLWQRLKYLPLGQKNEAFLTLGGDVRSEFQRRMGEDWDPDNQDQIILFQRFMLHADWQLNPRFRVFTQLKNGTTVSRNEPILPIDKDVLGVHQFFAEFEFPKIESRLRVGRQELWYGSRRLISVREGTNVRQSFDGLRWMQQQSKQRLEFFFFAHAPVQTGIFDNRISTGQLLWGTYFVRSLPGLSSHHLDAYYLGTRNRQWQFDEGNERELRHSVGLRHWGEAGRLQFDSEAVFQFGQFADKDILAWTISTKLDYRLSENGWQPTLGLKSEIISGEQEQGDDRLQTFNPLYPRGGYFGLLAAIGPANLMDIHPSLYLSPAPRWQVGLDWDFFWRYSLNDGIYRPDGQLNVGSQGSRARFIGHQPGVAVGFSVNRFWEISGSYFYFFSGDFLKDATPGADFEQATLSASLRF